MRVCVVGSGGREHALAEAVGRTADVVVCPGNAGMSALGVDCVPGPPEQIDADLFVIGPEQPLVDGLADRLRASGKLVFGPGADGARLEGSKAWMKDVLAGAGVPTAAYGTFGEAGPAIEFLKSLAPPWVVKTDGLAAGKGVLVTGDLDEACADVEAKLAGLAFGDAGRRVVVEEGLSGPELSLMAVCDGKRAVALAPAQDFKRALDGDHGPNTGGMGAYSPVPAAGAGVVSEVMGNAVEPTLSWLSDHGVDFRGILYAGLMLTSDGPKVLEFNVRFGDPETQVLMPRWGSGVVELLAAAAAGRLDDAPPAVFGEHAAVCVVAAAPGYPESPQTGAPIEGLERPLKVPGVHVFAAGVGEGPTTAGGRVLGVTGTGSSLREARDRAYRAVGEVSFPGMHFRTDIAAGAAEQEEEKR
ncbi:MAG TPA: phosphoribosylamine--glycine ligase [Acidimicrobiales bacterium]|nr:phosphoribosylamine--glycine ligase [Acidimicrobiales bacterium]